MTQKEVLGFIEEWVLLYPDIEWNGYKLRSRGKDCVNKMLKLCNSNPLYTKDVIFAATKMYLAQQAERNYEYTKQAIYFISKLGEPSLLESFCQKILNNEKPKQTTEFYITNDFI